MLALRRAAQGGGGVVGSAVLPLLRASEPRWKQLYASAAAEVPEPWLEAGQGGIDWL